MTALAIASGNSNTKQAGDIMRDEDWRPGPTRQQRRVSEPKPITIFVLREWDGADGCTNPPTGYMTHKKSVAEEWVAGQNGRSYDKHEGVVINNLEQMPEAAIVIKRQKALAKLSDEDKEILGLK